MTEQNSLFSNQPVKAQPRGRNGRSFDPSMREVLPVHDRRRAITKLIQTHTPMPAVPVNGSPTSAVAAVAIKPRVGEMHRRIMAELEARGKRGATRQELADNLPMKLQTVCGRVNELIEWRRARELENERRNGRAVVVLV